MSKISLCPHENVNRSGGISKPPDGIDDDLSVKDLTGPLTFPPSVLMKKWTCLEISCGMCPAVIKLEKCLFFILIAQACGSVSNDYTVVSNSTVALPPTFEFYPRCCFINMATPWSHSCCESKSIHVNFVVSTLLI